MMKKAKYIEFDILAGSILVVLAFVEGYKTAKCTNVGDNDESVP